MKPDPFEEFERKINNVNYPFLEIMKVKKELERDLRVVRSSMVIAMITAALEPLRELDKRIGYSEGEKG